MQALISSIRSQNLGITEQELTLQQLDHINSAVLFFQSGYLTISHTTGMMYMLKFPNKQADVVFTDFFATLAYPKTTL